MSTWSTARLAELLIGGSFAMLGTFIGIETITTVPAGPAYAAVGPRAFPGLIGAGLIGIGTLLAASALRQVEDQANDLRYDWSALFWIVGTLASQIMLLPFIGWVPAATIVFIGAARAFGSRSWLQNTLIGLGLAAGTFVLFNAALGLDLPTGQIVDTIRGR